MPTFRSASSVAAQDASFTCNKPTGTVSGDMLLLCQATDNDFGGMGTPTGGETWNPLESSLWPDGGGGMKLWWKFAGASEPASYGLTQQSAARDGTCSIICVQNPGAGTLVVAKVSTPGATTNAPTPSTLPTAADDFEARFVGTGDNDFGSYSPPAGFTERTDLVSTGQYSAQSCATRNLSSSGATGVHNFTSSTARPSLGFTVDVSSITPPPQFIGWGVRLA